MKQEIIKAIKETLIPEISVIKADLTEIKHKIEINAIKIDDTNKRIDDLYNEMRSGFQNIQSQISETRGDIAIINSRIDKLAMEKANQNVYERIEETPLFLRQLDFNEVEDGISNF